MNNKKDKHKPFIKIERRSSGEYAYMRFPYYDPDSKNTKYRKKVYLGKVTGRDENGDPIIKRVRGKKSRGKGKDDIDIGAILKENYLFKSAVKDLSTQEKNELIHLCSFLIGRTGLSDLPVTVSKAFELLEKLSSIKVERVKPKATENIYILQTEFHLKTEVTLRVYGLDISGEVKTKKHTVLIRNTNFFPFLDGYLHPPYDSITSLFNQEPSLEDNSFRIFDVQEMSRNIIENALSKDTKIVVLFTPSNMDQLKSVGIDIDKGKTEGSPELKSFQDKWGSWRVKTPRNKESGYIYNFRAKPAEMGKVANSKRKVDTVKNKIIDRFNILLEAGDFIKPPTQTVERSLKLVLYLGYIIESHIKN